MNTTSNPTTTTLLNVSGGFVAHRDGCADIKRELRFANVYIETTGITDLEAYMQSHYGFDAGYGDEPGGGWHATDVNRKPCTR